MVIIVHKPSECGKKEGFDGFFVIVKIFLLK